ncbi:hypothetical protein DSUL_130009 [Desulfovibrionales bacterium]
MSLEYSLNQGFAQNLLVLLYKKSNVPIQSIAFHQKVLVVPQA